MSALSLLGVSLARGSGAQRETALRDVSLGVEAGEIVLLEGPSGAGKTTLLCVAAGLLTPDVGEVVVGGTRSTALGAAARRAFRARAVGFVFQRANLLDGLTVLDNVALAGTLAGLDLGDARRRASRMLDLLDIGPLAGRRTSTLSGGEEHRVAVARALVHEPAVVLADEPTGSLDGESGHAVAAALASLADERRVAVLIATHDARLRPFADRRLRIIDGRVDEEPEPTATRRRGTACVSVSSIH